MYRTARYIRKLLRLIGGGVQWSIQTYLTGIHLWKDLSEPVLQKPMHTRLNRPLEE
jgi:hypothetical protein